MSTLDPTRWRAASKELDRGLELQGEERVRWLAGLRARDAALADDVEHLLAQQDAADAAGFLRPTQDATRTFDAAPHAAGTDDTPGAALAPGTIAGPYRIAGVLGRGGMGVVYEADEVDSGRRVALKVLEERLDDERARQRFEREGRLAASIDHPHCVFVFAAWEVEGRPAIAMELMAGTLADRVQAGGAMPPEQAVDAVLQLVSGLQAAAEAGILHRDVKPSNCFVDGDGTVKIGDFGISRSLQGDEETVRSTRGQISATPAYASPEQLRGGELDARSDIYSLGATLYELLTARRPFERSSLMALLMAVANDAPTAPCVITPAVPRGLSEVVMRCLAKAPDARFPGYDALRAALVPFASSSPSPATIGRRFVAGLTDHALLWMLTAPFAAWFMANGTLSSTSGLWALQLVTFAAMAVYFGASEAWRGATPGKAMLGLKVVDVHGRPLRAGRALARACTYVALFQLVPVMWLLIYAANPAALMAETGRPLVSVLSLVPPALAFATSRRRNGYAAFHDWLTATRVRSSTADVTRVGDPSTRAPGAARRSVGQRGVFDLHGEIQGMPVGWRHGFDRRLRRPVWIREVPPGTPPITAERAHIQRATRLRWLAGRRTDDEAWDVFEAAAGVPLRQTWRRGEWNSVRWWLLDLAREHAAAADAVNLRPERIRVLDSGRVKVVDDPALDDGGAAAAAMPCGELLRDVVREARAVAVEPWPVGAHAFIRRLEAEPAADATVLLPALEDLVKRPAATARTLRAISLLVIAVVPILMAAMIATVAQVINAQVRAVPAELRQAARALHVLDEADRTARVLSPSNRTALEVLLVTRYRGTLDSSGVFAPERYFLQMGPRHRTLADALLSRRQPPPQPSPASLAFAERLLREQTESTAPVWFLGTMVATGVLITIMLGAFVTAAVARGLLLRALGLELVTADGRPASRGRVLWRAAVAWSPMLALIALVTTQQLTGLHITSPMQLTGASWAAMAAMAAGAAIALAHPARGLQDRAAGTWIVPR